MMTEQVSFNVNAELYENDRGELAVRLPDERVYRLAERQEARFQQEAVQVLVKGQFPTGWRETTPRELASGRGWHCISRFGFLAGEEDRPALELEVAQEELGSQARTYLGDLLH